MADDKKASELDSLSPVTLDAYWAVGNFTDDAVVVMSAVFGLLVTTGAVMSVVDAGNDLDTDRLVNINGDFYDPGAGPVYWTFDVGVDPGAQGENVTNGQPGDIFFVAAS